MQTTKDITSLCAADVFSAVGKKTPVTARFSTVVHERGSPESLRDIRGFSVKFYTQEGNWDFVGNVRDTLCFWLCQECATYTLQIAPAEMFEILILLLHNDAAAASQESHFSRQLRPSLALSMTVHDFAKCQLPFCVLYLFVDHCQGKWS